MSTVFLFGCTAPVPEEISTNKVLDPCNCSSFYILVTNPRPNRQLQICPRGELWHYKDGECGSLDSVVSNGACNRKVPWDRCQESKSDAAGDAFRAKMKNKCIENGRFDPDVASTIQDRSGFLLSTESQYANLELVAASFVAGCIITLIIVAMVLTICGLPSIRLPKIFQHKTRIKTTKKRKIKVSKKSTRGANPSGLSDANVSVVYEDIDKEENKQRGEDNKNVSTSLGPSSGSSIQTTRIVTTTKIKTTEQNTRGPSTVSMRVGLKPPSKPVPFPKQSNSGLKIETNLAQKTPAQKAKDKSAQPLAKTAMSPPRKKTPAEQQPSFGYIHPK